MNRATPFRANKEFHFTIYRAAEMPVLLEIIENMWLRIGPFLHFSLGVRRPRGYAANMCRTATID